MFPLYDSSQRHKFPIINTFIILFTVYFFFLQVTSGDFVRYAHSLGFIPRRFELFNLSSYVLIITSLFLHGGIWHIGPNLWFLHVFGDNVEDKFGHLGYAIFYIAAGIFATLTYYFTNFASMAPLIGASGAISAVAGAYLILFRTSKMRAIIISRFFFTAADLPAWIFLGHWFLLQAVSAFIRFDTVSMSGIAWAAHIGGFIFGVGVAALLKKIRPNML